MERPGNCHEILRAAPHTARDSTGCLSSQTRAEFSLHHFTTSEN